MLDVYEAGKIRELAAAQHNAAVLFDEMQSRGLIRAGIRETQLNQEIYTLAQELFGISTYWHKRIVRAGVNTLLPYAENPPDLLLREDEILFVDLGPVFDGYEADFGRTFVLGINPDKLRLRDDVGKAFAEGKLWFSQQDNVAANELFAFVVKLAADHGWEFGGEIAGHLIGEFPHERIANDKVTLYVHPGSSLQMKSLDENGKRRHWILEIHFVDRQLGIGGFFEELLTI